MCDVGYLCANYSLHRLLCSRLRPDVRDRRQTDRQTSDAYHCLMPPPYGVGGITANAINHYMPNEIDFTSN